MINITDMYVYDSSFPFSNMDRIPPCHTGNAIPPRETRRTVIRDINLDTGDELEHEPRISNQASRKTSSSVRTVSLFPEALSPPGSSSPRAASVSQIARASSPIHEDSTNVRRSARLSSASGPSTDITTTAKRLSRISLTRTTGSSSFSKRTYSPESGEFNILPKKLRKRNINKS